MTAPTSDPLTFDHDPADHDPADDRPGSDRTGGRADVRADGEPVPLRVLLAEDQPRDADLVLHELRRAGFEPLWLRVDTEDAFVRALEHAPQIVIADYSMGSFDALTALRILADRGDEVPVIVVSGSISEETCVESLRRGAVDYLLKDRLARLGPAVSRALAAQQLRRSQRDAERRLRAHQQLFQATFDHGPIGMAVTLAAPAPSEQTLVEANAALCRTIGRTRGDLVESAFGALVHPDDRGAVEAYAREVLRAGSTGDGDTAGQPIEVRLRHAGGHSVWTQLSTSPVLGEDGRLRYLIHQIQDITERHEAELARQNAMSTLQWVVDNAPAMISLRDLDGRFLMVNTEFERRAGLARDQAVGGLVEEVLPAALAERMRQRDERCLRRLAPVQSEEPAFADGSVAYLCTHYPLLDATDTVYGVGAIYIDITDFKRTERDLRAAQTILRQQAEELTRNNAELQKLDRLKNDFVASVSHELRTPLTCVRGYTELLAHGKAGALPERQRRIVDVIDRCGRTLHALIEDLLTVSSIDSGAFRLMMGTVALGPLVERVNETLAPALTAPGLRLVVDVEAELPPLHADARQLERVLTNLITNAVKFSPNGGTVRVSARRHVGAAGTEIVVAVSDTGIGIPHDEQDKMFTRFFRASTARDAEIQGTGLGLAIVKTIVEYHGGWIHLESTLGRGTTVTFGLPLTPVPVAG